MIDLEPEDVTEGPIPRALTFLALPLVAQNLVQVVNAAADVFWLGRLGEGAVAAVGLNAPLMGVIWAAPLAATVGTQVLVSQRIGAAQRRAEGGVPRRSHWGRPWPWRSPSDSTPRRSSASSARVGRWRRWRRPTSPATSSCSRSCR